MAYIQANFFSQALMRTVAINVILPVDKVLEPGMPERGNKPYKTLYLLHGVMGNHTDWINGTRIQRFAEEKDLAVVMPSGDNSFYVDQPASNNFYGEFVGHELVEVTRKMFPLSQEREDTFIGGLSMGGYGALRNGLKYHDTFGYIASLSGALRIEEFTCCDESAPIFFRKRSFVESRFGSMENLLESDMNPKCLIEQLLAEGARIPKMYMACGDEDMLLPNNQDFVDFLGEKGVDVTFEVGSGDHNWDFWDTYIKKAVDWLPTEEKSQGINSGNVRA